MELLTAKQMREIEQAAIASGEVSGLELMERAGCGAIAAIFRQWPELECDHVAEVDHVEGAGRPGPVREAVILCGPGNNGGDGFVVARLLRERNWHVRVYLMGDATRLPPDARTNCDRWSKLGEVVPLRDEDFEGFVEAHPRVTLYVDALFGTGLSRPVAGLTQVMRTLRDARQRPGRHVVCIDMPSGFCADSGRFLAEGPEQVADATTEGDLTVTFHRTKVGLLQGQALQASGRVVVADIGLHPGTLSQVRTAEPDPAAFTKPESSHKYEHGHALIVSGGPGKTGAARLAARGALRIGAGLVTLACPLRALPEAAAQVTAIMLSGLDGPSGLSEMLEDRRFNAICLGPGLGLGQVTADLVKVALETQRACVLDADALSRFQRAPEALFEMLHAGCVLTPHGGEFARLFPDITERLEAPATTGPAYSKVDATRDAAARAGSVVLFKGQDTVIAAPDGRVRVHAAANDRGAPWLATAGAGDVLAGFITGLLARGFDPLSAAETACWLHVECARHFGPALIAEDLPEALPGLLSRLARQP